MFDRHASFLARPIPTQFGQSCLILSNTHMHFQGFFLSVTAEFLLKLEKKIYAIFLAKTALLHL